jgi:tetratricopeptide (TPR) repeat protein
MAKADSGDRDGAMADFTEAIRLDPKFALAYNNRGWIKANRGDRDGAIADYTEAIRLDPNYPKAYANRAIARDQLGDKRGASEDQAAAARIQEQVAFARFREEITKASLSNLLLSSDKTESNARERNRAIIAAKNQQLPAILRDSKAAELSALVVKIEQTILDLNHESEVAKDRAQQATATNGDARQIEELRGLTISYRERIELLKPILTALKEEIANRGR